jgi:hypothetical protein
MRGGFLNMSVVQKGFSFSGPASGPVGIPEVSKTSSPNESSQKNTSLVTMRKSERL